MNLCLEKQRFEVPEVTKYAQKVSKYSWTM